LEKQKKMRIIPIDNKTTLVVLQEIPMSELMKADGHKYVDLICNVSGTEDIVLYRQDRNYFNEQFWYIENVELEIERSDLKPGNDWRSLNRQKSHNKYFREVKSIMISYIREKQIDKVLKKDNENEYLWC
jgi:hypothetical protein